MKRYIDVDALIADMEERCQTVCEIYGEHDQYVRGYSDAICALENTPTADVAEVRHARWSWETGEKRCTNCGVKCPEDEYNYLHPQYCHACGAKMDAERSKDK